MNNIQNILESFISDIAEAKKYTREEIIIQVISERLDKCLTSYVTMLNKDIQYLKHRKEINLIRKLNK